MDTPLHASDHRHLSGTFDALLDEPCIPEPLRRLRRPPPDGITFRALTPDDMPSLFALFDEPAFRTDVLTRSGFESSDELRTWLAVITPADRFEVAAMAGEDLVGFVGLYPQADHMSHVGSLMLGVSVRAQGRGIGGFLLQTAILSAWFVAGLSKIALTVFTDNAPAVGLYRAAGFEVEGVLRRFTLCEGRARDAYAMGLLL